MKQITAVSNASAALDSPDSGAEPALTLVESTPRRSKPWKYTHWYDWAYLLLLASAAGCGVFQFLSWR